MMHFLNYRKTLGPKKKKVIYCCFLYRNNQGGSFTGCLQQLAVVEFRISHGDKVFRVTDNDIRDLETWKNDGIQEQFFPEDTIQGYSAGAGLLRLLRSKSVNLGKLIFTTEKQQFQICLKFFLTKSSLCMREYTEYMELKAWFVRNCEILNSKHSNTEACWPSLPSIVMKLILMKLVFDHFFF